MYKKIALIFAVAIGIIAATFPLERALSHNHKNKCYPLSTLRISFAVVFPKAKRTVMYGERARDYLRAYNEFGRPTSFEGDTLFFVTLPTNVNLIVVLKDGVGCHRLSVGPMLHKVLMKKIEKERT